MSWMDSCHNTRTFTCTCGQQVVTHSRNKTKCEPCRKAYKLESDRLRQRNKRQLKTNEILL